MSDIMVDLETWGVIPGCAIRSIGAVAFDAGSLYPDHMYCNVTLASNLKAGLHVDAKTEHWWARQSPEAQLALINPHPIDLRTALSWLKGWIESIGHLFIWSHGSSFDIPILACAYHALDIYPPWDYRKVRDTRTLYGLTNFDPKSIPFEGTQHNALDDARYQARCVQQALAMLRETTRCA